MFPFLFRVYWILTFQKRINNSIHSHSPKNTHTLHIQPTHPLSNSLSSFRRRNCFTQRSLVELSWVRKSKYLSSFINFTIFIFYFIKKMIKLSSTLFCTSFTFPFLNLWNIEHFLFTFWFAFYFLVSRLVDNLLESSTWKLLSLRWNRRALQWKF